MNKTPKLRFKEFSGEWESKKLGDIAIKVGSGKTPRGGNSVYTDSGVVFLRSQNVLNGKLNLNDVAYISEEINSTMKSTEVHGDDILLNITGASIGRSCKVPTHFPKANVNQHVCIIRLNENYNSSFIMNQIISSKVQRQIDSYQAGGNREGLNFEQIKSMKIGSTTIEEQEKIASFFSLIDKKISLQSEKVEMLKEYKKGMMQKIFSRKLKFKDDSGRDYPEWEEKKIKDIFTVTRGVVIAKNEISDRKSSENQYPVYSSQTSNNGILGYDSKYDFEGDYLTWTTDGANAGKVFARKGKFRCTNVCGVLVEKEGTLGFANKMISEILNKETPKHVSYVGNPKLMNGVMADIKIKVPVINEQIKISKVLDCIDLKIEKEQDKLYSLNEYKKGLLQQMFI